MLKNNPDRKFYSLYAIRKKHEELKKSKESIIISSDCFWTCNDKMLNGINYEIFKPSGRWAKEHNFSPSFSYVYKEMITAIECNETKYIDEIIFVGLPWEIEKANKYFGDGMLITV